MVIQSSIVNGWTEKKEELLPRASITSVIHGPTGKICLSAFVHTNYVETMIAASAHLSSALEQASSGSGSRLFFDDISVYLIISPSREKLRKEQSPGSADFMSSCVSIIKVFCSKFHLFLVKAEGLGPATKWPPLTCGIAASNGRMKMTRIC